MSARWWRRDPDPAAPTLSRDDLHRLAEELDTDDHAIDARHDGTPDGQTPWWQQIDDTR